MICAGSRVRGEYSEFNISSRQHDALNFLMGAIRGLELSILFPHFNLLCKVKWGTKTELFKTFPNHITIRLVDVSGGIKHVGYEWWCWGHVVDGQTSDVITRYCLCSSRLTSVDPAATHNAWEWPNNMFAYNGINLSYTAFTLFNARTLSFTRKLLIYTPTHTHTHTHACMHAHVHTHFFWW